MMKKTENRSRSPSKEKKDVVVNLDNIDYMLKNTTPILDPTISKYGYFIEMRVTDYTGSKYTFKQLCAILNFCHVYKETHREKVGYNSFYEELYQWDLLKKYFGVVFLDRIHDLYNESRLLEDQVINVQNQQNEPEISVKTQSTQASTLTEDGFLSLFQGSNDEMVQEESMPHNKIGSRPSLELILPDQDGGVDIQETRNFVSYLVFDFSSQYQKPGLQYPLTYHKERFEIRVEIPRNKPWEVKCISSFEPKFQREFFVSGLQNKTMNILENNVQASTFFGLRLLSEFLTINWRDYVQTKTMANGNIYNNNTQRQIVHEHIVYSQKEMPEWFQLNKNMTQISGP